ncbi:MAG: hypothetical protein FJW37_14945 [Acidobacteria bacterium]|nr:hypothetical protein [Acidobacteriota bacterium]
MTPSSGAEDAARRTTSRWSRRLSSILLILFSLELGIFLLIFPWSDYWRTSFFATSPFWANSYLRGGVSGLGVLNVYISLAEVARLRSS